MNVVGVDGKVFDEGLNKVKLFLEINGVFIIWGIYCEYYIGGLDKIVSLKKLMLKWLFLYFDNIFKNDFKK